MKKLVLLLLAVMAVFATSCKEDKYSAYNYGYEYWSNSGGFSMEKMLPTYNKIADEFIKNGYVLRGYQIMGDDITKNDEQALVYFNQNLDLMKTKTIPEIEKMLVGTEGAPFTITVSYLLLRGTEQQTLLGTQSISINVEAQLPQ